MAILIEGTAERLLLPKMIEKLDTLFPDLQLGSQYLSVVEVGGAYAHRFFKLIEFLEIKTLIITDLDSINSNDGNKTCIVSKGDRTSNACIKTLFGDNITPQNLILKTEEEKIRGFYRIAYQIPEHPGGACGRSFEEAFILANQQLFHFNVSSEEEKEELAWVEARKVKKVEFALKYALEVLDWNIPRYIMEGLLWLGSTFELTSLEKYAEAAAGLEEFHDSGV
jgi:hypothetical protein